MRNFSIFLIRLAHKVKQDNLFELANGLAFKILLAFFPFIVFLMSLLGFLNLDDSDMLNRLYNALPYDIYQLIARFLTDIHETRSTGLLSTSLVFTLYNTSNGFRAVINCINRAYGYKDTRGIIRKTLLSMALMLTFTLSIVVMLVLLIFGNTLFSLLAPYLPLSEYVEALYTLISALVSMLVLVVVIMFMYKLACARAVSLMNVFPGAFCTVLLWVLSSAVFGYFLSFNRNYSVLYGSIAGVFILTIWLNLISLFLLLGNEINSLIIVE